MVEPMCLQNQLNLITVTMNRTTAAVTRAVPHDMRIFEFKQLTDQHKANIKPHRGFLIDYTLIQQDNEMSGIPMDNIALKDGGLA